MTTGDISYSWLSSGSTIASANTAHGLFGTYNGLSALNARAVVHVQLQASGADFMLLPSNEASANQDGLWFKQDIDIYVDIPPLLRTTASELHFLNLVAGDNAVVRWMLWERAAL